jgi:hypothetical protein
LRWVPVVMNDSTLVISSMKHLFIEKMLAHWIDLSSSESTEDCFKDGISRY